LDQVKEQQHVQRGQIQQQFQQLQMQGQFEQQLQQLHDEQEDHNKQAVAGPSTTSAAGQPRQPHAGSFVGGRRVAVCAACGTPESAAGGRLHLCRGCRLAWFCSDACYRGFWPTHKVACREEQARRAGQAASKMGRV
jgi:hypothetical protein